MLRLLYDRYKETLSNYAVDLDFSWFRPHSLQALRQVTVTHLLAAVQVKRGQILLVKLLFFFLFFRRSEMYGYHRNKISTIWYMQEQLTTVLMQQFLSKCSRKNQAKGLIEVLLTLKKTHFQNLLFILFKQIHTESNPL